VNNFNVALNESSVCLCVCVCVFRYLPGWAGHKIANGQTITGTLRGGDTPKPALYPSWPASSPWVTAVGATRFQGQEVGNPEMATDQVSENLVSYLLS
jgi:hypothetical protein